MAATQEGKTKTETTVQYFRRVINSDTKKDPTPLMSLEANGALDRLNRQAAMEESEDGQLSFDGLGNTEKFLSSWLRVSVSRWEKIRDELKERGFLAFTKDNYLILVKWGDEQGEFFEGRAYMREYQRQKRAAERERKHGK